MAYFLVQPGQVLVSPTDGREFTADAKGIVEVSDDLQTVFHGMGASLWVEAPSKEPTPVAVPDVVVKSARAPKVEAAAEEPKAEA